jgi:hypothetical protein
MNAPPKETGALLHAPKTETDGDYHACKHGATTSELMSPGHVHHAREVCIDCGKFLRWLPKRETLEKGTLNAIRLEALSKRPELTDWERSFVRGMQKLRKFSPRQQVWIDRLCETHLWRREAPPA